MDGLFLNQNKSPRSDTPKRLRVVNEANRSGDREEDENEDESEGVDDILDEKVY